MSRRHILWRRALWHLAGWYLAASRSVRGCAMPSALAIGVTIYIVLKLVAILGKGN